MRSTVLVLLVCMAAVFGSESVRQTRSQRIALPARPQGIYEFTSRVFSDEEIAALRAAIPFRSIELKQWGPPDLINLKAGLERQITIHRDGTATYVGVSGDSRIGTYTGEVDLRAFGRLCVLLDALKVQDSEIGIEVQVFNPAISQLTLYADKSEEPIVLRNDRAFGDYRFWLVESLIMQISSEIEWGEK